MKYQVCTKHHGWASPGDGIIGEFDDLNLASACRKSFLDVASDDDCAIFTFIQNKGWHIVDPKSGRMKPIGNLLYNFIDGLLTEEQAENGIPLDELNLTGEELVAMACVVGFFRGTLSKELVLTEKDAKSDELYNRFRKAFKKIFMKEPCMCQVKLK